MDYHRKISGPILDHTDLFVNVESVEHRQLLQKIDGRNDDAIRRRVAATRKAQRQRFNDGVATNAMAANHQIRTVVLLQSESEALLNQATESVFAFQRAATYEQLK